MLWRSHWPMWPIAAVFCVLACGRSHFSKPLTPSTDIENIRAAAEDELRRSLPLAWDIWTGQRSDTDAPAPAAIPTATHTDDIKRVTAALQQHQDPKATRALTYLRLYLLERSVQQATSSPHRAFEQALQAAVIPTEHGPISLEQVPAALAALADPKARRHLGNHERDALQHGLPTFAARTETIIAAIEALGYADTNDLWSRAYGVDVASLRTLAENTLRQSDAMYGAALAAQAKELTGLSAAELTRDDLPRLLYASPYDDRFAAIEAAVVDTLLAMGIDLAQLPITIDTAERPNKKPQAATFPIALPNDIRISLVPQGTAHDGEVLLHELGHALHFAHTLTAIFEFQMLGNWATAEGFAILFQTILASPQWLAEHVGLNPQESRQFAQAAALRQLLWVRREAARVLFEIQWAESSQRHLGANLYAQLLSRAYGIPLQSDDSARHHLEFEPFFKAASYLQGWLFAAELEVYFREKFGPTWWRNADAAHTLQNLWQHGQRHTPNEVLATLGVEKLRSETFMRSIAEVLGHRASHQPGWQATAPTEIHRIP